MNWSNKTQNQCELLIEQMNLPGNYHDILQKVYMPLVDIIVGRLNDKPLLISISGAQGTGKTTLTRFLKHIIESEIHCPVAVLSIDDFYLTREERQALAARVHPLLVTRGVPGTHDITLLEETLHALINQRQCRVPRFDKAIDDRCDELLWTEYNVPVKVILFEGWCNNSPFQTEDELFEPVNELERDEDKQGVWRHYVNEQLKEYHKRIFSLIDMCIMLKAPDYECIYEWRSLQEHKLKSSQPPHAQNNVMSDSELKWFIQHFERISRHSLRYLPDIADVVLPIAKDHSMSEIVVKKVYVE